jgi:hypothetical protein
MLRGGKIRPRRQDACAAALLRLLHTYPLAIEPRLELAYIDGLVVASECLKQLAGGGLHVITPEFGPLVPRTEME